MGELRFGCFLLFYPSRWALNSDTDPGSIKREGRVCSFRMAVGEYANGYAHPYRNCYSNYTIALGG